MEVQPHDVLTQKPLESQLALGTKDLHGKNPLLSGEPVLQNLFLMLMLRALW